MKIQTEIHSLSSGGIITDLLELGESGHDEKDSQAVLDQLVTKIAQVMRTDVCSLYLLDQASGELVLRATKGLNPASVNKVRMKLGEGLVGKTIEWLKPVSASIARKSKKFKFFPETGEERYSSFLSVPLIYNRNPVGVIVVQTVEKTRYSSHSVHLLMTLAIPTVGIIEKAKLLGTFERLGTQATKEEGARLTGRETRRDKPVIHEGIGASPGSAIGKVRIVSRQPSTSFVKKAHEPLHADVEKMRVLEAFRWVEEEISDIRKKASKKFGMEELSIFDAYEMVLGSQPFKEEILHEIEQGQSALEGVEKVVGRYTEELSLADDDYIRERVYDIRDLGRKVIDRILYGAEVPKGPPDLKREGILLSDFWSIADFVEMDLEKTKGILSPYGGASSHIAILAKSLGIPAVLGLSSFADLIHESDQVIMDGSSGVVILHPTAEALETYSREIRDDVLARKNYLRTARRPAVPKGGRRITMGANMGIVAHVHQALENGAEEIGLYRTEFPFLVRRSLPTEEEQFNLYRRILISMAKRPVTIRTLDIGGDKYLPYLNLPKEANPFLGWRSIRISLERQDLFRIQLRALLRASVSGRLRLLFPMISSVEEIRQVKDILADVMKELKSQSIPFLQNIPIGIMIEVPSAVEMAETLIKEVDFFSIGTNDLIQYTLAVDRNNAKVAKLYNPFHPAVLRLIQRTIKAARKAKKPVSVCGEMADQPLAVALLVGMGITNLSMSVPLISKIKSFISQLHFGELKQLTSRLIKMESAHDICADLEAYLKSEGLDEFLHHPTTIH